MKFNTAAPDDYADLIQDAHNEQSNASSKEASAIVRLKYLKDCEANAETIEQAEIELTVAKSRHEAARENLSTLKRLAGQ